MQAGARAPTRHTIRPHGRRQRAATHPTVRAKLQREACRATRAFVLVSTGLPRAPSRERPCTADCARATGLALHRRPATQSPGMIAGRSPGQVRAHSPLRGQRRSLTGFPILRTDRRCGTCDSANKYIHIPLAPPPFGSAGAAHRPPAAVGIVPKGLAREPCRADNMVQKQDLAFSQMACHAAVAARHKSLISRVSLWICGAAAELWVYNRATVNLGERYGF